MNTLAKNDKNGWGSPREVLLLFVGIVGTFIYIGLVEAERWEFHFEVLLLFGAWTGVWIASRWDKK